MALRSLVPLLLLALLPGLASGYDREDYEEEAGSTFALLLNSQDDIYGLSMGSGVWLKGTPIFGDYFLRLFWNGLEDATYSGIGMSLRLMPHFAFAPFVGGGGSYNHSLAGQTHDDAEASGPDALPDRGDSYWGGHAEAGIRIQIPERAILFECALSQTWSSLPGDRDYWLVSLVFGGSFW